MKTQAGSAPLQRKGTDPVLVAILRGLATLMIAGCLCSPASAGPIDGYFLNPLWFGHMIQPNGFACAPTSVVNSMVFLEFSFPSIYGLNLVGPTTADMLSAEKELETDMKMDTGVSIYNFVGGKKQYFKDHAPNTTSIGAETSAVWWDPPPGVIPNTKPTAAYIISNLKKNRDVEIDYLSNRNGTFSAHAVTVTGMTWNSDLKIGGIYYIDPDDGKLKRQLVTESDDGYLSWQSADLTTENTIRSAVWEGPTPEPGTFFLLGPGFIAITSLFRKRLLATGSRLPRVAHNCLSLAIVGSQLGVPGQPTQRLLWLSWCRH